MEIVLASSNKHKVQEMNDIVKDSNVTFILPPEGFDPIEDGDDFETNSYIKAIEAWKLTKTWCLADDSGLCIDALGGKPGIYSARYAETPALRIARVLKEMEGIKDRDAHFNCAMTLINPKGETELAIEGKCYGSIALEPSGENGFGYDPIFLVKDDKRGKYSRTMAELSEDEKNQISHRSVALRAILDYITTNLK